MSVTTTISFKEYQANGIATNYTIPFLLFSRNDLKVYLDNQPMTIGYTIRGLGNPSSEIIFEKAPEGKLLLQRSIELLRETDYQENGDLLAKTINQDFDRIYLAMQGFDQAFSKSLKVTDATGVNDLPLAQERANKLLSFDSEGQPLMISATAGSAMELGKQLADASDLNKGAGLVGYNQELNYLNKTVGHTLNALNNRFNLFEGNGVPLFAVYWWPSRASIPNGYVAADGQELSAATYPDAALGIRTGQVPLVTELEWQTDPVNRGSYVANASEGMFRLPDYNGRYADSMGALFLRGDNGQVANGKIQRDGVGNAEVPVTTTPHHNGLEAAYWDKKAQLACGISMDGSGWNQTKSNWTIVNRVNQINMGATETRPLNINGCWIIKLFGYAVNAGQADIQKLATDYANLAARFAELESYQKAEKFTIIYPNGGTAEKPAEITIRKRYEESNPFPKQPVICDAEIFANGVWGSPGWLYNSGVGGYGVTAGYVLETDKVIIQTGNYRLGNYSDQTGGTLEAFLDITAAPCRVRVWRV